MRRSVNKANIPIFFQLVNRYNIGTSSASPMALPGWWGGVAGGRKKTRFGSISLQNRWKQSVDNDYSRCKFVDGGCGVWGGNIDALVRRLLNAYYVSLECDLAVMAVLAVHPRTATTTGRRSCRGFTGDKKPSTRHPRQSAGGRMGIHGCLAANNPAVLTR